MDATADVGAVKAKVRDSQGYGGEENVVLVHKGKVLTDDATLESVGVTEESFVVVMVQGNPQILQPMLAELQRQNPQLYHLINANQEEFLALLNEPLPDNIQEIMADFGGEGGVPELDGEGEGDVQIELTAEERNTVDRLVGLGFPLEICVEAYLACDKNEQLAANYLLNLASGGMD